MPILHDLSICRQRNIALYFHRAYSAFWCGSVKVVGAKKPEDSLLCACDVDTLTDGKRLKVLRLRAGLTAGCGGGRDLQAYADEL